MTIHEAFMDMSDDFKAKVKGISLGDFKKLVKDEKIELTPEQEEAIAGGTNPLDICCFDSCDTFYK